MIEIDQLTYTYPGASAPALADLTLRVTEGEFVLVTGPSGAGKSTLLRCLNGLVPHFAGGVVGGRVTVAGHDPIAEGPQVLSRVVGFVFQDPQAQFVLDRVEDEIAFGLENEAIPPAEMRVRVEEALHLLDLAPLRDCALDTLSGGERQRVAIAAALAFHPRVLVLDEPTSQLDPQSAEGVLQTLVRLNRDLGLTIVLAEHRLERVLPYTDRLVYLPGNSGKVLDGPPRRVLQQMELTPPLVTLGKVLGWNPLPLTIKEGRAFAASIQTPAASQRPMKPKEGQRLLVRDLHFAYDGADTLRGIDLDIAPGELVALMGRNGSGKTTLLKCIVGLLRPRQGQITLDGQSIAGGNTAETCRHVGYLPQEPDAMLFADTVMDELQVTLHNHGLQNAPPIAPIDLLARLRLDGSAAAYPRDLSAGQRQRVALGAVTVTRPGLLLLDEPTRGLDYWLKRQLVALLREWQGEGASVVLVTHDVELVAQAADRVVILSQGQVIADDAPQVLTASPLFAPQVARLFPGSGWLVAEDAVSGLDKG